MAPPIITRESDGLRFEPTVQPGMVRCEACLALVEPSQIREHVCIEWWEPENQYQSGWLIDERMSEPTPVERGILERYNRPPQVLRRSRR